jgi:hypothetical protein
MLLLEEKNKMLHLRLKAFDLVCFCLDLSTLLNLWIWSCMLNGVIGHPSLQCCYHHLLFLILIISLLSLFHGFPLCPEQNIYWNIALLKSLWNYLSNMWSFIENGVQTRELCPFYFSSACCPKLISGRVALGDSGITACRNPRLTWFLIGLNHNFIVLLNIQTFSVFPSRPHKFLMRSVASCALIRWC